MQRQERRYSTLVGAEVRIDPAVWLSVPVVFDLWNGDHRRWASELAEICWADSGNRHGSYVVENLALRLAFFAEAAMNDPLNHMYLHLPDPKMELATARIQVLEPMRMLDRDAALRDLVEADGAIQLDVFTTDALGRGLRSRRTDLLVPDTETVGRQDKFSMLKYGWCVAEFDVDVVMYAANSDLKRLDDMAADLDALANQIRLDTYERLEGGG